MPTSDFKLDALLRAVTVPSDLLERLLAAPYADDAGLDAVVCDVELPEGLLKYLAAIPLANDEVLDEALRNVPVPTELETSFRRSASRASRHRSGPHRKLGRINRAMRINRMAMATSLIVAIALSLGSAVLLSWLINLPGMMGTGTPVAQSKQSAPAAVEPPLETSWRMLADDDVRIPGFSRNEGMPPKGGTTSARQIDLAELDSPLDRLRREEIALALMPAVTDTSGHASVNPVEAMHESWDIRPELRFQPTALVPHGLDWPLVPGSNRQFLIEKHFHPFVVPRPGSELQSCAVPLAVEPSSYELARRYLERNEMPPPDRVRTEDFLAAVDYGFPKPSYRGLGLTAAGGASPISGEGFSLLQVGVQAWQGDSRHAPMHLVLLVNTSASMRWGSRVEIVRRALAGLPEMLGPQDRVSLVTFNQAAHVLVEDLGREAISQFRAAADSLAAEGSTNFLDGLHEASGIAHESLGANRPPVRMVLLTDGLVDLEPSVAKKVQEDVAESARKTIRLDVIDLGQQQKEPDPQLAAISRAGQGSVLRAVSAEQIRWALREIVTGRSQLVARSARLRVTFNPRAVLEYRIIGHEANDWASLLPGTVEADFREGQSATGLFELRLAPKASGEVAKVDLSWYLPDDDRAHAGRMDTKTATVRRGLFDSANAPPWFQQAGAAAYTAEVLRHSPFIFQRNPSVKVTMPAAWRRALELASAVDRQASRSASYQEFVDLIRQEAKARSTRGK